MDRYTGFNVLLLLLIATQAVRANDQSPDLKVVYPKEGDTVMARDSAFVFGHVRPADSRVFVNGVPARKYDNGAFLAMVPVRSGDFLFRCFAVHGSDTSEVQRRVHIPAFLQTGPVDFLGFDTTFVFPAGPVEVMPGDRIALFAKGTPGCRATATIEGLDHTIPLREITRRKSFDWEKAVFAQGKTARTT